MFTLFAGRRAQANHRLIDRLHDDIVASVRQPAFYLDYSVADTFEGRFELMAALSSLVVRRLNMAEPPGPAVAQDLVDAIFRRLDPGLRELGVGDLAVPKRMKRLAEAFLGRCAAYDAGLRTGREALRQALERNVYAGSCPAERLALYAESAADRLAGLDIDHILTQPLPFPDPRTVG